jgi:hypothetical protein
MHSFPKLLRRQSVIALATIVGVAVTGLTMLFACAPMMRPAVELPMNALDHTGFNIVPNHETAESIAVAVSRAMLEDTDNLEFTQFLPFNADLDGASGRYFRTQSSRKIGGLAPNHCSSL